MLFPVQHRKILTGKSRSLLALANGRKRMCGNIFLMLKADERGKLTAMVKLESFYNPSRVTELLSLVRIWSFGLDKSESSRLWCGLHPLRNSRWNYSTYPSNALSALLPLKHPFYWVQQNPAPHPLPKTRNHHPIENDSDLPQSSITGIRWGKNPEHRTLSRI